MNVQTRLPRRVSAALCAELRHRLTFGAQRAPSSYMNLPHDFRLQAAPDGSLALYHVERPDDRAVIGYEEYAEGQKRWYLNFNWREPIRALVDRLGLETPDETEVPF